MSKSKLKSVESKVARFLKRHELELTDDQHGELIHMIQSLLTNRDRVAKYQANQIRKLIAMGNLEYESKHLKAINGGLKQTITTYGPITTERVGSASKRILAALLNMKTQKE
jgi:hypothetical protein